MIIRADFVFLQNDRKTIVQVAAKTIHQLQCWKRELEKRNYELEAKMGIEDNVKKIRVSIGNPISGIDSILEVLNCLKMLGSTVRSMQSQFSDEKLTAVIDVETQVKKFIRLVNVECCSLENYV